MSHRLGSKLRAKNGDDSNDLIDSVLKSWQLQHLSGGGNDVPQTKKYTPLLSSYAVSMNTSDSDADSEDMERSTSNLIASFNVQKNNVRRTTNSCSICMEEEETEDDTDSNDSANIISSNEDSVESDDDLTVSDSAAPWVRLPCQCKFEAHSQCIKRWYISQSRQQRKSGSISPSNNNDISLKCPQCRNVIIISDDSVGGITVTVSRQQETIPNSSSSGPCKVVDDEDNEYELTCESTSIFSWRNIFGYLKSKLPSNITPSSSSSSPQSVSSSPNRNNNNGIKTMYR